MMRRFVGAAVTLAAISAMSIVVAPAASASTTSLLLSQSAAFSYLGHSCGGIQEQAFATGFDLTSGFPTGNVFLSTRCGGSGRGGGYHVTTYSAWVGVTWDYTGAVVTSAVLSSAPSNDPTFTAFDAYGNELYNASNSAFLVLSPTFTPPPRLTAISVTSGPASGGTSLTITGDGLTSATAVSFGGVAAASFTVNGDTSITAVTPSTGAGTVDVTVTTGGGTTSASSVDQFTFVAAPTVTGISPNSGPLDGGTSVTITGTNLTPVTSVTFGGIYAPFTVDSDTSITATSPAGENVDTVGVTVTSLGGTSASSPATQFAYTAVTSPLAPAIAIVSPNTGPAAGGTAVTIKGTNFTGATAVDFGTTPVSSFTVNIYGTAITAHSPPGTDTVDVSVSNLYGSSATSTADLFSYGPRVTKVAPVYGSAGGNTKVTISGHNFTGADGVMFGSQEALSYTVNASGTAITAVSPPEPDSGVQAVDVTVSGPDGTSPIVPADVFTYVPPAILKLSPTVGSAGGSTKVTISGHYFVGTTDVTFGGQPALSFTVNAAGTSITAVSPPEIGSGVQSVDVSVTTPAGTGTLASGFAYVAPVVTTITPTSGATAGGTTVTVKGTSLYGATEVDFGSTSATIVAGTATSLTVIAPPGSGVVPVTVTTPAGTSTPGSLDQFTYV
jgi:hypothetical protein